ncbi:MAG TPA: nuclear transport factor 2 family protein [Pyrinomonadaceae bacterium]|nr:nuclear transport factor 2 family protein [Pyrinomonadaceae bacterium]
MKRFLTVMGLAALASVFVVGASSCTVAPNSNNTAVSNGNASTPANANANLSNTSAPSAAELTAKEKQLWDALKNRDYDAFGKMMASDAIYVSTDGVYAKAETIDGVRQFAPTEVTLSDWKTVTLDEDAMVVTYTVDAKGTSHGQPIPQGALRASTAWVKRGTEWVAVYHQDSPVREAAANAPTPAAETSKPSGSTANANTATSEAKHAEMVASDDPVAIEKHLWEALRRKDWDTFAAHLAPEQIEVEPGGVFDRAGTLASLRGFDFSKTTTSDFKAVKFDDDATLVTYMVRGTRPDGKPFEHRASTIWVKRDGKWLAYFHHGTPAVQTPAR